MNSQRQLFFLATSIFLGVVFPGLAAWCKPLLYPLVFLLFVFAILQVSFGDAAIAAFRGPAMWLILFWQLLVLPTIAALVLKPLLNTELFVFAIVALCTCTITATTALSRILGLNDALALVVGLAGSVLMPLPLYFFMTYVLELATVIDLPVYVARVGIYIVLPFILVYVFRCLVSADADAWVRAKMPPCVLVVLMLFGLAVMDGVQALLIADPWRIFSYILLSYTLSIVVQVLTRYALAFLGERDATTAALVCSYRNMGVIAAISGAWLGEYFFIFVGIWQLPMYTLPLWLKRFYQQ